MSTAKKASATAHPNQTDQELRLKVGNKIPRRGLSMWNFEKVVYSYDDPIAANPEYHNEGVERETLSFVWDIENIKQVISKGYTSDDFKGYEKTGHLWWRLRINPCSPKDPESFLKIGLEHRRVSTPCWANRQLGGVYAITILDKDSTILFATKSFSTAGFIPMVTRWHSLFPASQLDRYLVNGRTLRIHVELVLEMVKQKKFGPRSGLVGC